MRNDRNKQRNNSNNFKSDGFRGDNRGFRNNNFSGAPREMHKVTCSDCKVECEVPFKPSDDRPVYCKDCFAKHKPKRF